MILVDVHAHLEHPMFANDLDKVIERAKQAGVKTIIAQGVHHEVNLQVLEIAKKYDIVKAAFGLYPLDALNVKAEGLNPNEEYKKETMIGVDETLAFMEKHKDDIVALGEIGMDFKYSSDVKPQKENFQKLIDLSEKIKKPMIIHTRKAEQEVIEMLKSSNVKKADLHVFSGNKKLIKEAADFGLSFSIPPIITRSKHFQMLVEMVDLSQLMTETDCPWLGPEKDERNEPVNVIHTIEKIAEIKGMDKEEVANNIFINYQRMFE